MSLKIEKKNEGTKDTVMLSGRLDTTTAPELDVFAEKELADTQELVLDFADLEYISSAGLRVLLKLQKVMNKKESMKKWRTYNYERRRTFSNGIGDKTFSICTIFAF